jgi:hemolysin III
MRPLLRGYIHVAAFVIALGACTALIMNSHGLTALISNTIYSITLIGLYAVSALYHCPTWGYRHYLSMRRVDHAAIFILIAGTATPVCLIGLNNPAGIHLLSIIWSFAIIGIIIVTRWSHSPKWVRAVLYVAAGWIAICYLPELKSALTLLNFWLLIIGGIIYTIGALVYASKRPDLYPRIYGYHEVFHTLVVIASALQFSVIYRL